jgi:hypothetical protein
MLLGATATLAVESLAAVELETVTPKIEDIMSRNGFERVFYDPFARRLSGKRDGAPSSNSLFVRDRPFVERRLAEAEKIAILGRLV